MFLNKEGLNFQYHDTWLRKMLPWVSALIQAKTGMDPKYDQIVFSWLNWQATEVGQ